MEQKAEQQKTVLIVEDEKNIVDILRFNLQREGYRTVEAYDGADGLEKARSENPDIILLDVMLPKMIGFDVCRTLRDEGNNVPVIILTAREEEADKVLGLEIGADDYITKPFSMRELIARVGANIRRTAMNAAASASAAETAMPVTGGLSINTDSHQVFRDGTPLELTTREYELLTFLASHPNKVYSRIDLMEQVWNYGYVGEDQRTVDVTVRRLRENRNDPRQSQVHSDPPGRGLLFRGLSLPLSIFLPVRTRRPTAGSPHGKGGEPFVPQSPYQADADSPAAHHIADGGGGRVFDHQRHQLLYRQLLSADEQRFRRRPKGICGRPPQRRRTAGRCRPHSGNFRGQCRYAGH